MRQERRRCRVSALAELVGTQWQQAQPWNASTRAFCLSPPHRSARACRAVGSQATREACTAQPTRGMSDSMGTAWGSRHGRFATGCPTGLRVLLQPHQASRLERLLVAEREQLLPGLLRLHGRHSQAITLRRAGRAGEARGEVAQARVEGRWAEGPLPCTEVRLAHVWNASSSAGSVGRLAWRKKMSTAPSPVPFSFFSSVRSCAGRAPRRG